MATSQRTYFFFMPLDCGLNERRRCTTNSLENRSKQTASYGQDRNFVVRQCHTAVILQYFIDSINITPDRLSSNRGEH
jgi:hypothetical protein